MLIILNDEVVEDVKTDICQNYCKYPDAWDVEKEGMELCESDICYNCPLNRLEEGSRKKA